MPMQQALDMCGPGQDYERAHVLRELGELARNAGDLAAAETHYQQAIHLLRASDDPLKLAHTLRHLGDVYATSSNWTAAEPLYMEALTLYRQHPQSDPLDLANAIRPYAFLKTETEQPKQARELWAEACTLYASAGINAGVEECRERLDQLHS